MELLRTNAKNRDFIYLVDQLDEELALRDGKDHAFYDQFNKLDDIKYVVLVFENEKAVACGAIKKYDASSLEVKRMYTLMEYRSKGLASLVLKELETWAAELGFSKCILETGIRQAEAIRLYLRNSYKLIPNYGQYENVVDSRCFEKNLI